MAQPSFVLKAKRNGKGDLPSAVLSLGRGGVRGSEPGGPWPPAGWRQWMPE